VTSAIVFGLLPDGSSAESAISSLVEEDFHERTISVVMKDESQARAIAADGGPLRGTDPTGIEAKITELGGTADEVLVLTSGIEQGQALLAVSTTPTASAAAAETLRDYGATYILTVETAR
jgi:hypothetical protein